jgi:hypothetical protein
MGSPTGGDSKDGWVCSFSWQEIKKKIRQSKADMAAMFFMELRSFQMFFVNQFVD